MSLDFFRHSFVGQAIYYASGRRLLRFPEERPGYVLPSRYLNQASPNMENDASHVSRQPATSRRVEDKESEPPPSRSSTEAANTLPPDETTIGREYLHPHGDVEKGASVHIGHHEDPELVDWDGPDDPESPYNVSSLGLFITALITGCSLSLPVSGLPGRRPYLPYRFISLPSSSTWVPPSLVPV
jgi:MFS transporter, DHA1 family, multidrug resistance protein